MKILAIILAAGKSERLGRPKQLLKLRGSSLVRTVVLQAQTLPVDDIVVITGCNKNAIENEVADFNVKIIHNIHFEAGMSSTLSCGINYARKNDARAVLIMLSDQPLIPTDHYKKLLEVASAGASLVSTTYADTFGAPTFFAEKYFDALNTLSKDMGAKALIKRNRSAATFVECQAAQFDVDTETDWQRILKQDI